MRLLHEISFDFDVTAPKVTASGHVAIIENIEKVILIGDSSVTVYTGRFYVSVRGQNLVVSDIWEGRMEVEGEIEGIEFYKTLDQSPA